MPESAMPRRPRPIMRAFSGLSRYLRRRHDRRRVEQLRRNPHLARDLGLPPALPEPESALRRRTDWRSRW